jgi:hypothetical protein
MSHKKRIIIKSYYILNPFLLSQLHSGSQIILTFSLYA